VGNKAYLILENGKIFEGCSFGSTGEVVGEVVFTTAMTGYLETLTDPSYYGQIVVQTFPLIGNYGVIPSDFESKTPHLKAYIVREWCQEPSNFRCEGDLDTFLKEKGIIGLYGIDTRALTRIVREHGVMNAIISDKNEFTDELKERLHRYKIEKPVDIVGNHAPSTLISEKSTFKVALLDFGAKKSIADELVKRGCDVTIFGADTKAAEILAIKPDGVMLTNGPGDPLDNTSIIEEIKKLAEKKIPIFGICLGHQLLALSQGATSEKLKYGHRGGNQPAIELKTGKVYITSQNHGYAIISDTLPKGANLSYINANDKTCEGIVYDYMPAFTVQFHPEASCGPLDTRFLFDQFIALMQEVNFNAVK